MNVTYYFERPMLWAASASKVLMIVIAGSVTAGCATYNVEQNISTAFDYAPIRNGELPTEIVSYETPGATPRVQFVHGIPTNSYLWRNVMPIVEQVAPVAAFDLPGYGHSGIPQDGVEYSQLYDATAAHLDAQPGPFVIVVNDLGSLIGLDYAMRNQERIDGIVLVEAIFMPAEAWYDQLTFTQRSMFVAMQWNYLADVMITHRPRMQAIALDMGTIRELNEEERAAYLEPYQSKERRRVVREGPGPATIVPGGKDTGPGSFGAVADRNAAALVQTNIPILLVTAEPGFITREPAISYARENFENLTIAHIGDGKHFLPEDQPTALAKAISDWLVDNKLAEPSDSTGSRDRQVDFGGVEGE